MKNSKTQTALAGLIVVLTAALCFVIYDSIYERIVGVGDSAPSFRIVSDSGREITPEAFGGKLLVLNFWATWCPPCVEEMPSLDEMQKRLAGKGVVVVGISVDKNENLYRQFLDRTKVSFQTARDPSADISASYGTFKFPETYVIDSHGKVVVKYIGPRDWTDPDVVSTLEGLL